MITNFDLDKIAKREKIPLNAVFFKDDPPKKLNYGGYIINLQDGSLGLGGSHYVALYIPEQHPVVLYMDTFGFVPPQSTLNWLKKTGIKKRNLLYNPIEIQNVKSGGCGIYCLFFIQFMSKYPFDPPEKVFQKWVALWSADQKDNLELLKKYAPYYMNSKVD